MTIKSDIPAKRFFHLLFPHERFDNTACKGKALIRTAFAAYEYEWRSHGYNIAKWEYPFTTLAAGEPFKGDEPWAVLFRRAVEIADAEKPVVAEIPPQTVMLKFNTLGRPRLAPGDVTADIRALLHRVITEGGTVMLSEDGQLYPPMGGNYGYVTEDG